MQAILAPPYYTANTSYIIPIEEDQKYLLAILNSSLIEFFYRTISSSIRGGYLRFIYQWVTQIPIHHVNNDVSYNLRTFYNKKAKEIYEQYSSNDNEEFVLSAVNHHLLQQPEQSDVVHDLLAFLAETMLDLNQQKRALQKVFLDWLVTTLHIAPDKDGDKVGIEVLTGKSKLLEYAGDYQKNEEPLAPDALWDIVVKNRPRLGVKSNTGRLERARTGTLSTQP